MKNKSQAASRSILAQIHARQVWLPITVALLITGCNPTPPAEYEFHTAGAVLYRCNRRTGEVDWTTASQGYWSRIATRTDQAPAGHTP